MRIIFLGNTCNNFYNTAKSLRLAGHDCELYYDPSFHPQTFPEIEDPELAINFPDWIHKLTPQDNTPRPERGPSAQFLRKLATADIIHCEGIYLLWAQKSGRPYFWFPYGQDNNYFLKWSFWVSHRTADTIANSLRFMSAALDAPGINYEQGISTRLYFTNFVKKYYTGLISNVFFSLNADKFRPEQDVSIHELLRSKDIGKTARGLIIFNPTRIMFTSKSDYDYGSDLLLEALAELKRKDLEFTLLLCERNVPDEVPFKALAEKLGLSEHLIWLPFIPRFELPKWYGACHIVTNEFRTGGIGSITAEAMACGKPLLTCTLPPTDPTYVKTDFTSEPPIFWSKPLPLAVETLTELAQAPEKAAEHGLKCREWALDNLTYEAVAPKYIVIYTKCIAAFTGKHHPLDFPFMPDGALDAFQKELQHDESDVARIGLKLDDYPTDPRLLGLLIAALQHAGNPLAATVLACALREFGIAADKSLYRIPFRNRVQERLWTVKAALKQNDTLAPFIRRAKAIRNRLRGLAQN